MSKDFGGALAKVRHERFLKLDVMSQAVTQVLFIADPAGLAKMSKCPDKYEYMTEARMICKQLSSVQELSAYKCQLICHKACADYIGDKEANSCMQWPQIGAVVFWLFTNNGAWEI